MAKRLSKRKRLAVFLISLIAITSTLIIISILFSLTVQPANNNGNTSNNTTTTPVQNTVVIVSNTVTPKDYQYKVENAKNIKTINSQPLKVENFPNTYNSSVTLDISSQQNTPKVLIKPCTSKANIFAHRDVISEDEMKAKLKEALKTDIDNALKQNNIDPSNNTLDYSFDPLC